MKKSLPSALILTALLLMLCLHAFAANQEAAPAAAAAAAPLTEPVVTVQGAALKPSASFIDENGTCYLAAAPVLKILYPHQLQRAQADRLDVSSADLTFCAVADAAWFQVNQRYCYAPETVVMREGRCFLPAEAFCTALGCTLTQEEDGSLTITQTGAPVTAGTYDEDSLYWLSRAIYAEAGNQPMAGRVAVGTVILNRVAAPTFPDTVKDVLFVPGQFSPVSNGTIYREPDEDSLIAAKLCLDGAREAEDCLYFNVVGLRSWADSARTYVCTIGDHNFYL